jgi:putative Mn2+ efflux pump MntP
MNEKDSKAYNTAATIFFAIFLMLLLGVFSATRLSERQNHIRPLGIFLILLYLFVAFWYYCSNLNEKDFRFCTNVDLSWIVYTTTALGILCLLVTVCMLWSKNSTSTTKTTILEFILFLISITIVGINMYMIFPVPGTSDTNPFVGCWVPYTIPVIVVTFLALIVSFVLCKSLYDEVRSRKRLS